MCSREPVIIITEPIEVREPWVKCIGCGCRDARPCINFVTGGRCRWLIISHAKRIGLCSSCPEKLKEFRERFEEEGREF